MINWLLNNTDTLLYIEAGIAFAGLLICAFAVYAVKKDI